MQKRTMKVQITVYDGVWNTLFSDSFVLDVKRSLSRQKVKEIFRKLFEVCLRYNKDARKTDDKKSAEPPTHDA
jgi:hypothetical protein